MGIEICSISFDVALNITHPVLRFCPLLNTQILSRMGGCLFELWDNCKRTYAQKPHFVKLELGSHVI